MSKYKLFLSASDKKLEDKSKLRVDILGGMKVRDIEELRGFNILYISQGHEDFISIKGIKIHRKVRYIQVFKK